MIVVARDEIMIPGYGWLVDGKATSFLVPGENVLPDDIEPALRRKLEVYAEHGYIEIRPGDDAEAGGIVNLEERDAAVPAATGRRRRKK